MKLKTRLNKKTLARAVVVFIILLVFYYLGSHIWENREEVRSFNWSINYFQLFLSLILLTIPFLMMAVGWYFIIKQLQKTPHLLKCVKVYTISQFARYIPGKVFIFIGRVILAQKIGISKSVAAISVFIEAILSSAGAFFAILILYIFSVRINIEWINTTAILLLICFGLLMIHPFFIKKSIAILQRLKPAQAPIQEIDINISYLKIILLCVYYTALWVFVGAAFYLFVGSFILDFNALHFFFDTACIFVISWLTGFLSFLAPGGLGVREGILSIGLKTMLPVYIVSIIVIIARLWFTVGELLCLAIVLLAGNDRITDRYAR